MAIQTFVAGQTLTASQMNTLQGNDYNYTRNVQTGTTYTLQLSDRGLLVEFQNSGTVTLTVPAFSSVAFDVGDTIEMLNASTGVINIVGAAGVTVSAPSGVSAINSQWQRVSLINRATNTWALVGSTSGYIPDGSITADKIADGTIIAADIADGSVTSAKILDGTIVNADINASAGIALSKLATGTAGHVIVNNASGVPTSTAISGDVTIDSTGNIQIASDKIVNADINTAAAIVYSKLNLASSIVNSDISSSAAIEQGKIADATIDTKTGNYVLVLTDKNKFIEMNVGSSNTVTVPTDASVNFPIGSQINITQYGSGKTYVVAATPATTSIRATPGAYLRAQYSSATLIKRAANEWYLIGDLSAS
jgi:hypothetical protein